MGEDQLQVNVNDSKNEDTLSSQKAYVDRWVVRCIVADWKVDPLGLRREVRSILCIVLHWSQERSDLVAVT